ncbi:hypothetical protein [Sphaerimonospora thailandensis]|uniref:Uncharacterized protein n=1 Tax=Sphaerimonospora thailandensis TaxID=795644 RepID=A0A8J3R573_9ACTN|nr:hypothetical protein [Sphaerimonospora thailandensis]GIH69431.1 hypothetical protein Mth01_16840 [Sphaerimonospora thailandensis]
MKIIVQYEHDPADLATIYLAVAPRGARPADGDWQPAYRDTVNGRRVIWIRADTDGVVWVRDAAGERQAQRLT